MASSDKAASDPVLVHANCIMIAGQGVLIRGDSGSGKTSFSLLLVRRALQAGLAATLVADDQTYVKTNAKARLTAMCPEPIKGLVEVRPYGVVPHGLEAVDEVSIELIVDLTIEGADVPRVQAGDTTTFDGRTVANLKLPWRPNDSHVSAVFVALGLPAWY